MTFSFDLISDLHVETWDSFDWTEQPTSQYCVVAGDITMDRSQLVQTLTHLGECYAGVFYIDGNDEHKNCMEDLGQSYRELHQEITGIPNLVYMQDNVVIVNGVALLATNGWWSYDFDPDGDCIQAQEWYRSGKGISDLSANTISSMAFNDATYLKSSLSKLQKHQDVKAIVIISHTLPAPWIVEHDPDIVGTHRFGSMGNQYMSMCLDEDSESKVHTWCFGHYHKLVDRFHNGVRYVNNPRGRGNTKWSQNPYYPKRIEIKF